MNQVPVVVRIWLLTMLGFWAALATVKWSMLGQRCEVDARWLSRSVGPVGEREIRVNDRPATVYAPTSYRPEKPLPLVLVFHGRRQRHDSFMRSARLEEWAERNGFIVAAPAGLTPGGERTWEVRKERDLLFIDKVIERLRSEYRVDANAVYVYGFSAGGYFALFYAWNRADRVAAFGMNSGGWLPWLPTTTSRPVPGIFIHDERDGFIPIEGMDQAAKVLRDGRHEVRTIRVERLGHAFSTEHLPAVWEFFRAHPIPSTEATP